MYYDHDKRPILAEDFDYDAIDGCGNSPADAADDSTNRIALAVLFDPDVRIDAFPALAAAYAYLMRLPGYESMPQAAKARGVSTRAAWRQLRQLRAKLRVTGQSLLLANKNKGNTTPR